MRKNLGKATRELHNNIFHVRDISVQGIWLPEVVIYLEAKQHDERSAHERVEHVPRVRWPIVIIHDTTRNFWNRVLQNLVKYYCF